MRILGYVDTISQRTLCGDCSNNSPIAIDNALPVFEFNFMVNTQCDTCLNILYYSGPATEKTIQRYRALREWEMSTYD